MGALVRAAALSNFAYVAQEYGLDPLAMLREFGLDPRMLMEPERRASAHQVVKLLEAAAKRSGCPAFGLRLVESRSFASLGLLGLMVAHQPTMRDVQNALISYRHLLNEAVVTVIEDAEDLVILRQELLIDPPVPAPQACEMVLGMLVRLARGILGAHWRPLTVHLAHPSPRDLTIHRRCFGDSIAFGSDIYALVCRRTDLDRPNPAGDPSLVHYAQQVIDTLPLARHRSPGDEVRTAIYHLLQSGDASLARVAGHLGETPRTLQRRLSAEGNTFSELMNEVRRNLVMRYLGNPDYSMLQISEMLGYAQPSAFTRWFVAQFGCSASRYRRNNGPHAPALKT